MEKKKKSSGPLSAVISVKEVPKQQREGALRRYRGVPAALSGEPMKEAAAQTVGERARMVGSIEALAGHFIRNTLARNRAPSTKVLSRRT